MEEKQYYLRALKPDDVEGMMEWMRDSAIQQGFRRETTKRSLEEVKEFIAKANTELIHGKDIHYAIADENDEYLGTISLKKINLIDRNAEYAVVLRRKFQGKGIATLATKQLLNKAFREFELEKVYLNVLETNSTAITFYEKFFSYEGTAKNHFCIDGRYYNVRWYAVLKENYL